MNKKIFAIPVAILSLGAIVGCGNNSTPSIEDIKVKSSQYYHDYSNNDYEKYFELPSGFKELDSSIATYAYNSARTNIKKASKATFDDLEAFSVDRSISSKIDKRLYKELEKDNDKLRLKEYAKTEEPTILSVWTYIGNVPVEKESTEAVDVSGVKTVKKSQTKRVLSLSSDKIVDSSATYKDSVIINDELENFSVDEKYDLTYFAQQLKDKNGIYTKTVADYYSIPATYYEKNSEYDTSEKSLDELKTSLEEKYVNYVVNYVDEAIADAMGSSSSAKVQYNWQSSELKKNIDTLDSFARASSYTSSSAVYDDNNIYLYRYSPDSYYSSSEDCYEFDLFLKDYKIFKNAIDTLIENDYSYYAYKYLCDYLIIMTLNTEDESYDYYEEFYNNAIKDLREVYKKSEEILWNLHLVEFDNMTARICYDYWEEDINLREVFWNLYYDDVIDESIYYFMIYDYFDYYCYDVLYNAFNSTTHDVYSLYKLNSLIGDLCNYIYVTTTEYNLSYEKNPNKDLTLLSAYEIGSDVNELINRILPFYDGSEVIIKLTKINDEWYLDDAAVKYNSCLLKNENGFILENPICYNVNYSIIDLSYDEKTAHEAVSYDEELEFKEPYSIGVETFNYSGSEFTSCGTIYASNTDRNYRATKTGIYDTTIFDRQVDEKLEKNDIRVYRGYINNGSTANTIYRPDGSELVIYSDANFNAFGFDIYDNNTETEGSIMKAGSYYTNWTNFSGNEKVKEGTEVYSQQNGRLGFNGSSLLYVIIYLDGKTGKVYDDDSGNYGIQISNASINS